jgi:pimeloyl-ACP methyl ester carboxylesterase
LQNVRKYGKPPFTVVLVHGGPGAAGTMGPVAKRLSGKFGVIEAFQTRYSIESLLVEMRGVVSIHCNAPVILIGHSWGAWLSILFASKYPVQAKKLILVGSGPLEERYSSKVMKTRLDRLGPQDADLLIRLMQLLGSAKNGEQDQIFTKIGELMRKADSYKPDSVPLKNAIFDYRMYEAVWAEAEKMRSSGELMAHAGRINCPVLAIHGDYDPHPFEGVSAPLKNIIRDFRLLLLERCGHEPWSEELAKDSFFSILYGEL